MRGCKRPSLMVPGEKWDFYGSHLASNNESSISDFFYEQKSMRKELGERSITEGYADRHLIRKQENQGCVKGAACSIFKWKKPIRATCPCQIPKSKMEGITHTAVLASGSLLYIKVHSPQSISASPLGEVLYFFSAKSQSRVVPFPGGRQWCASVVIHRTKTIQSQKLKISHGRYHLREFPGHNQILRMFESPLSKLEEQLM